MNATPGSAIPTRTVGTVEAEVDGETIILSPKDFSYFGLTGTGEHVWTLINNERSVNDIIADLSEQFTADPEVIRSDVRTFLDACAKAGIITLKDGQSSGS